MRKSYTQRIVQSFWTKILLKCWKEFNTMILNEQLNVIPRDINIIINLFHRTGESDVYFIRKYNNRMTVDEISNIHDKMKKVQLRYGEYEVTKVTVEDSKTIKIMCIYPWKVVRMMDYAVYMNLLFYPKN